MLSGRPAYQQWGLPMRSVTGGQLHKQQSGGAFILARGDERRSFSRSPGVHRRAPASYERLFTGVDLLPPPVHMHPDGDAMPAVTCARKAGSDTSLMPVSEQAGCPGQASHLMSLADVK